MAEQVNTIQVDSLWKIYKTGSQEVAALRGLSFNIEQGAYVIWPG
jgi:ABC-type lipoprotein export system ATPase subunit